MTNFQDLRVHLEQFDGGALARLKLFTSAAGHLQALVEVGAGRKRFNPCALTQ